jgi:hypothetical protein
MLMAGCRDAIKQIGHAPCAEDSDQSNDAINTSKNHSLERVTMFYS